MNEEIIKSSMSWDEIWMRHVYLIASKSKDPRTRIGSVLVKDEDIISVGYNNFPRKVVDLEERYNNREQKHVFVVHSESNSILNAARKGVSTLNSILYTQGIPCADCTKSLIQAGISKVVVHKQWPNLTYSPNWVKSIEIGKIMLKEANIVVREFDKVLGLKGFLDGKEVEV